MLKIIDRLLIKSFIPPFLMAFGIALFVLIMQFLWKYIDEIVGKGLDVWIIAELLFYLSMTLVPMALPIAVLIASVMVMGNFAERYELASMKSAGTSLWRVMMPLMSFSALIMVLSMLFSDYIIPYSNLKFYSRLYDIRRSRPALNLEAGTFNDDFKDITIRIDKKAKNNRDLSGIMMYDHSPQRRNENNKVMAKKGSMYFTADEKYLILHLEDGKHYQNVVEATGDNKNSNPYVRTSFEHLEKIFDLSEFDMNRTDEDLFKNSQRVMSSPQLRLAIDSINIRMNLARENLDKNTTTYFFYRKAAVGDSTLYYKPIDQSKVIDTTISAFKDFVPNRDLEDAYRKTTTLARRVQDYARSAEAGIKRQQESRAMHVLELHRKMSFAMACFIFLFIGAPMGAIVRKGGFGWPILIAIIFFVVFIVFVISGEKLAKEGVVSPYIGAWLPCLVLFPIGLLLTYLAINDSKFLNVRNSLLVRKIVAFFQWIRNRLNG